MQNSVSSDPEVLASFAIEVGKYIETVCGKILELKAFHERATDYWEGPQYDSLTEKIEQMTARVSIEMSKLDKLKGFITQKALELADAQRIKFGDD